MEFGRYWLMVMLLLPGIVQSAQPAAPVVEPLDVVQGRSTPEGARLDLSRWGDWFANKREPEQEDDHSAAQKALVPAANPGNLLVPYRPELFFYHSKHDVVPLRAIVLLSSDQNPTAQYPDANITTFAAAMREKVAPVLASWSIVNEFFQRLYNPTLKDHPENKALEIDVDFNVNEWTFVFKNDNPLILVVPKAFEWMLAQHQLVLSTHKTLPASCLKLDNSLIVPSLLTMPGKEEAMVVTLDSFQPLNDLPINHDAFKDYFFGAYDLEQLLKQKDVYSDETLKLWKSLLPPWNILFYGHGTMEESIVGVSIDDFEGILLFLHSLSMNTVFFESCFVGGLNRSVFTNMVASVSAPYYTEKLSFPIVLIGTHDASVTDYVSFEGRLQKVFTALEHKKNPNWLLEAATYSAHMRGYLASQNTMQILYPHAEKFVPQKYVQTKYRLPRKVHEALNEIVVLDEIENKQCLYGKTIAASLAKKPGVKEKNEGDSFWIVTPPKTTVLLATDTVKMPLRVLNLTQDRIPQFLPVKQKKYPGYIIDEITYEHRNGKVKAGVFEFIKGAFCAIAGREETANVMVRTLIGPQDFLEAFKTVDTNSEAVKKLLTLLSEKDKLTVLDDVVVAAQQFYKKKQLMLSVQIHFKYAEHYWLLTTLVEVQEKRNSPLEKDFALEALEKAEWELTEAPVALWNDPQLTDEEILTMLSHTRAVESLMVLQKLLQHDLTEEAFKSIRGEYDSLFDEPHDFAPVVEGRYHNYMIFEKYDLLKDLQDAFRDGTFQEFKKALEAVRSAVPSKDD